MGTMVGDSVGTMVGEVGTIVGDSVGERVGDPVGTMVGDAVGVGVGPMLGLDVAGIWYLTVLAEESGIRPYFASLLRENPLQTPGVLISTGKVLPELVLLYTTLLFLPA